MSDPACIPRTSLRWRSLLGTAGCALALALSAAPAPASQGASTLTSFADFSTWTLMGSASATLTNPGGGFIYSRLVLTDTGVGGQAGAGWAPTALTLDFNQPFEFSFPFYLSAGSVLRGDGLALVLADAPGLGNAGSGLGYEGLANSLAFAIDTFHFQGDPVSPSLQILQNGSSTPLAASETGLGDDIRDPALQWIAFFSFTPSGNNDANGSVLGTIWRPDYGSFSVGAAVDLSALAGSPVYWGFTGANGLADDGQFVTSAMAVPEPGAWALWLAGLGAWLARARMAARKPLASTGVLT